MQLRSDWFGLLVITALVGGLSEANAAFVVNIGGEERTAGGAGLTLPDDALTLEFLQDGDDVLLTVTNNLEDSTKDFNIMFNSDTEIAMQYESGQVAKSWEYGEDSYSQAGESGILGMFDVMLDYQGQYALHGGEDSTYRLISLSGTALNAFTTFNHLASSGFAYTLAAAHIGGLNWDPDSGKYGSTTLYSGSDQVVAEVPEPVSLALWSFFGCAGMIAQRRRRRTTTAV